MIKYPNTDPEDYPKMFGPCGDICSNYTAEIIAIKKALNRIIEDFGNETTPPEDIVIFSDSKSALQALETKKTPPSCNINRQIDQLSTSYGAEVTLQWIPGHAGVPGNEMADKLAKRGAAAPQFSPKISLQTCKQILRNNYRQEWLQQWASSKTGRSLYEHQQKPNPMDPLRQLERANQSLTFQLRTGHSPLINT